MRISDNIISIFLVLLAITSFFIGFFLDEISMGAGGFGGDFKFVKKSIAIFSENSIFKSIELFSESSNRPPLIYILHKVFNPFFTDNLGFRRVVFTVSLITPILFYLCLKERFGHLNNNLLILLASILFLNPFFRTSSFWGLEENYAIISALSAFIFLLRWSKNIEEKFWNKIVNIFFITFFSSLSIYFDQKFLIIPLICFFKIILSNQENIFKLFCLFLYVIFSIPYIFLIKLWGGIFPSDIYHVGSQFYFHHLGFAITIIAFIFVPFFFLKAEKISVQINEFVSKKKYLIILLASILVYLIILLFFYDDSFFENRMDGGGIIKKITLIIFPNLILKKIFIFFSILISWFLIFLFNEKGKLNFILTFYFLVISVIILPFYQEYFDPIIFLLVFFIFKLNFNITYLKTYFLYAYYLFFLIGTNIYYN